MQKTIKHIISFNTKKKPFISIVIAGGGVQLPSFLLTIPGISFVVNEVVIPYSTPSMKEYMSGTKPIKSVSKETAKSLAQIALNRTITGRFLEKEDLSHTPIIRDFTLGVSCSASLSTDRERKGENEAFISVQGMKSCFDCHVILAKDERNRLEQDTIVSKLIVKAIAKSLRIPIHEDDLEIGLSSFDILTEEETITSLEGEAHSSILLLLNRKKEIIFFIPTIVSEEDKISEEVEMIPLPLKMPMRNSIILSGSFNPLHIGHEELAIQARQLILNTAEMHENLDSNVPIIFELSILNVDKPSISLEEAAKRVKQFAKSNSKGPYAIALTNAPLFHQKAEIFPNSFFVIGIDTVIRLINKQYYENSDEKMFASFNKIRRRNCYFIVAGRKDTKGSEEFFSLSNITIPTLLSDMFIPMPLFRIDISSTEIRSKMM